MDHCGLIVSACVVNDRNFQGAGGSMGMDESVMYIYTGHCVCAWLITHYKVCPCEIFEERVRTSVCMILLSMRVGSVGFRRLLRSWHTSPVFSDTHAVVKQVVGQVVEELLVVGKGRWRATRRWKPHACANKRV